MACDKSYGIGNKNGRIPWTIKKDMEFFKTTTVNSSEKLVNVIIMGRCTADTFKKPLPNRLNVVITSQMNYRKDEGFISFNSLDDAINEFDDRYFKESKYIISDDLKLGSVFVIGGAKLVDEAIKHEKLNFLYINHIDNDYNCEVKMSNEFIDYLNNQCMKVKYTLQCVEIKKKENGEKYETDVNIDFNTYLPNAKIQNNDEVRELTYFSAMRIDKLMGSK
jgi:dihydrofolate reductase